jgi:hypothetical protein
MNLSCLDGYWLMLTSAQLFGKHRAVYSDIDLCLMLKQLSS